MPKQVLLFAALFMSLCFLGCNTTAQNNTTFAPVDYDQAFKLGQMVTFRHSGAYIARTSGISMEPVLTKNTIIIVQPIDFDDLEMGMMFGYRTQDGVCVLHQLIRV